MQTNQSKEPVTEASLLHVLAVRVQPGPSFLESKDYDSKVKDYAARALEILTIRARVKKVSQSVFIPTIRARMKKVSQRVFYTHHHGRDEKGEPTYFFY